MDGDDDGKLSPAELETFPRLKARLSGSTPMVTDSFRSRSSGIGCWHGRRTEHRTFRFGQTHPRRTHAPRDRRRGGAALPGARATSYDEAKATPVVIAFHGGGGNPESMVRLSGLNSKSDEAGFIIVYPYGSGVDRSGAELQWRRVLRLRDVP